MPEAQHTGLGGSSLGGLVSIYMGQNYPDVFRKLLIVSPSIWWDNKTILSSTHEAAPTDQQFWVYVGTGEGETTVENSKAYVRLLKEKGVQVTYIESKDGQHSERSWAAQAERMLTFFAGKE